MVWSIRLQARSLPSACLLDLSQGRTYLLQGEISLLGISASKGDLSLGIPGPRQNFIFTGSACRQDLFLGKTISPGEI
jgi:hypothetical protein